MLHPQVTIEVEQVLGALYFILKYCEIDLTTFFIRILKFFIFFFNLAHLTIIKEIISVILDILAS